MSEEILESIPGVFLTVEEYQVVYDAMEKLSNDVYEARSLAINLYKSSYPKTVAKDLPSDHWLFDAN